MVYCMYLYSLYLCGTTYTSCNKGRGNKIQGLYVCIGNSYEVDGSLLFSLAITEQPQPALFSLGLFFW